MRRVALVVAIVIATVAAAHGQGGRFVGRVDVVRVDVLVTERGKPVKGLTASDFEVRDNGVVQQVDLADPNTTPVNAILALDLSQSVDGDLLTQLRGAGHALLGALLPGEQACLVSFSHLVTLGSRLTPDLAAVGRALDATEAVGDTSLIDAAYTSLILSESDEGRALVLAFSDGLDTASWLTPERVLDIGRRANAVVYGVSVRDPRRPVRDTFLKDLASATGGSIVQVDGSRDLSAEFVRILTEFRHRYLLRYSARGVTPAGFHKLEVRVKGRNVTIKARPGYQGG